MGRHDSNPKPGVDYAGIAEGLDELRECLRIMSAGIVSEGFTDEQAREIVTSIFRGAHRDKTEEDGTDG